jgi:hypothetical protein
MKTTFKFFTILLSAAIFVGCTKSPDTPALSKEEQAAKYLSGTGNKVWRLKAVKVNDVPQVLTASQLMYTKTYTMVASETTKGTFTDYDNYFGDWNMKGASAFQEVFQQIGGGSYGFRDYTIISLNETTLNAYYIDLTTKIKVEELYNAY